jgi:hypothetical protein
VKGRVQSFGRYFIKSRDRTEALMVVSQIEAVAITSPSLEGVLFLRCGISAISASDPARKALTG